MPGVGGGDVKIWPENLLKAFTTQEHGKHAGRRIGNQSTDYVNDA